MIIKTNNYRQGIIEYLLNNHILHKTKNGKIHVHKLPKELIPKKSLLRRLSFALEWRLCMLRRGVNIKIFWLSNYNCTYRFTI